MGYQSGSERKYLLKDARKHPLLLRRHHSRPEFLLKGRDQSDDRVFLLDDPGFTIPNGQVCPFVKVDRRVINDGPNRSQVSINLNRYSGRLSNWQSRIPPNPLSPPLQPLDDRPRHLLRRRASAEITGEDTCHEGRFDR